MGVPDAPRAAVAAGAAGSGRRANWQLSGSVLDRLDCETDDRTYPPRQSSGTAVRRPPVTYGGRSEAGTLGSSARRKPAAIRHRAAARPVTGRATSATGRAAEYIKIAAELGLEIAELHTPADDPGGL